MSAAIEIKNLTKQYQVPFKQAAVNAVDNLSLRIEEGEIFGFLGANGAGKTTTIKILLGLIYATEGEAFVLGAPAGDIEAKHKIAYLPESPYFPEHMSALEVVTYYAQLFGMKKEDARKRAEELVDLVGLGGSSDRNKRIHEFSKGMRQRVGIAQSLINDPKVLFYDEPTSGLDAVARRDIRDLMLTLKSQGKTMFLSSHQLEDVERVCHRASIIHKGKLRVQGFVDELLAGELVTISVANASARFSERIKSLVPDANIVGGSGTMTVNDEPGLIAQILDFTREENARVVSIIPKRRTLEDIFVQVVGGRLSTEGDIDTAATPVATSSTPEPDVPNAPAAPAEKAVETAASGDATVQMRPNKYKEMSKK